MGRERGTGSCQGQDSVEPNPGDRFPPDKVLPPKLSRIFEIISLAREPSIQNTILCEIFDCYLYQVPSGYIVPFLKRQLYLRLAFSSSNVHRLYAFSFKGTISPKLCPHKSLHTTVLVPTLPSWEAAMMSLSR